MDIVSKYYRKHGRRAILALLVLLATAAAVSAVLAHTGHPVSDNMCGSPGYGDCTTEQQWIQGWYTMQCHLNESSCQQSRSRHASATDTWNARRQVNQRVSATRIPNSGPTAEPGESGSCYVITVRVQETVNGNTQYVLRQRCGTAAEYLAYKQAGGRKQFDD